MAELKAHMNSGSTVGRHRSLPQPYLGYTPLYPKIKNASVACSLMWVQLYHFILVVRMKKKNCITITMWPEFIHNIPRSFMENHNNNDNKNPPQKQREWRACKSYNSPGRSDSCRTTVCVWTGQREGAVRCLSGQCHQFDIVWTFNEWLQVNITIVPFHWFVYIVLGATSAIWPVIVRWNARNPTMSITNTNVADTKWCFCHCWTPNLCCAYCFAV